MQNALLKNEQKSQNEIIINFIKNAKKYIKTP